MPVDVQTTTEIDRPRDEVAACATDPDNATTWYENITSVEWETPPPVAVGSRIGFVARFLGRRLAYTYEVRELEPGRTPRTWPDSRRCSSNERDRPGKERHLGATSEADGHSQRF